MELVAWDVNENVDAVTMRFRLRVKDFARGSGRQFVRAGRDRRDLRLIRT